MGGGADVTARMETVAKRVDFIDLLTSEAPLAPRDIVDALPHSRATVTRALRELREAGVVEKEDGGYRATIPGMLAAQEYHGYRTASTAVLSADSLLTPIPAEHAIPAEVLVEAETILAEGDIPVRALETVSEYVQRADRVRAFLPTLVNTHLLRVWHRSILTGHVESTVIFDPDLLTVLKGQYPHLLAEMAGTDGFSAFSTTGLPYGIILTTDETPTVAVLVYEDDTSVRGVLTNESPDAVDWARARLAELRADATEVTAELDALSDAVADGVSLSSRSSIGASPPRPSAEEVEPAAEGHALPIDLEAEGFVRVSGQYFASRSEADPAVSWRTGFTLTEIHEGHAVDRLGEDGRNLTTHLLETLREGRDHVVLGPPGSGKSTVCMATACEWFDRGVGPVLYRERGDGDHFQSAALLEAYLRQTDGHALVVVEDAVRDEANAIFRVMQTLDADPSVTFLLDSRAHEWQHPRTFDIDARLDAYRRTAIEERSIPDLNERECERFVSHFAAVVDADLDLSGAELFRLVEEGTARTSEAGLPAGDALIAQHYLARRHSPPVDADASVATALDQDAARTYRSLADSEVPLAADLAVFVATLTAAGIPVADEYLYAITTADQYAAIDEAIPLLDGRLLFEQDRLRTRGTSTYRTRHETWAMRFLEQFQAIEPARRARERVGRCMTGLLALADEPDRREGIRQHLGGRTPRLHQIEADPAGWADELAERLFSLGRTNASLAPLFGETNDDFIELPDACSAWTRLQQPYWRGVMNRTHGDLDRAEREFEALGELAKTLEIPIEAAADPATPEFVNSTAGRGEDVSTHRTRWLATSRSKLGAVARDRGAIETAEAYHREALELFREIDDPVGEAISLKNLGAASYLQSDYEAAREHFELSLAITQDLDARAIEARCLNNLGIVAQDRDEYDLAREHHRRSLAIKSDIGDRQGEANSLSNLGLLTQRQGAYDRAREYHERSLDIKRDLGDRQGEATSLNNLGLVARAQGEYDRALDYLQQGLRIRRTIGDRRGEAHSLNELGELARLRGEYDRARQYADEAMETFEEVGSEAGIARTLLTIGRLALARGELDRAREYADEAREIFEELGSPHWVGRSDELLGRLAAAVDGSAEAEQRWGAALDAFETVGAPHDALSTLKEAIRTCHEHGDERRASEWYRRARAIWETAPAPTKDQYGAWIERTADERGVEHVD